MPGVGSLTATTESVRFVLDNSVSMAWGFADEASSYADHVLELLQGGEAIVPALWPLEVANVLLVGERRGRLTEADSTRFQKLLRGLPIWVMSELPEAALDQLLFLGRTHGLSAYDAAYLELAMREGLPLATLDSRLRIVSPALGIKLITD